MVEQIFIVGLIFGAARIFGGLLCGYLSYLAIKSIAFAGRDASAIESDDPFDFIGAFRKSVIAVLIAIIAWVVYIALLVADTAYLRPKTEMPSQYKGQAAFEQTLEERRVDVIPPAEFDSNMKDRRGDLDTVVERFDALPDAEHE